MTRPALAVIVVNYGSDELVERNLKGLDAAADGIRVFVVDNFCSIESSQAMEAAARRHGWNLISSRTNLGFGAAVNRGARRALAAGCDCLVFLNPDASISLEDLQALGAACSADRAALISPVVVRTDGSPWFRIGRIVVEGGGLAPMRQPPSADDIGWLTGACLAVHRDLWERLGGFDDDYFLYWEDVDLSFRCREIGGHLIVREDLTAVHMVGGTQGGESGKSSAYYHYNCRNRLIFAGKHLGWRDQLRWVLTTPRDLREVLNRGGSRQYLHLKAALWPAATGCLSGLGWLIRLNLRRRSRRTATAQRWTDAPGRARPTNAGVRGESER